MNHADLDMNDLPLDAASQADIGSLTDTPLPDVGVSLPWDADSRATDLTDIVGTPDADIQFWQPQTTPFTCAVMAQCGIINAFTGESVSEAQLVYEATVNGWLSDQGMSPLDVGNLLNLHGIDCHNQMGATIEDLMAELAQGHKVIVGVDSGEIWNQDSPMEDFFGQAADHAIWVTGVNMSDPANPKVIINDSGDPNGAGKEYDMATFVDAWEDSGFFYVATDTAPPDLHLAASGFDPATGLFSELAAYFAKFDADFLNPTDTTTHSTYANADPTAPVPPAGNPMASSITTLDETARDDLFKLI